MSLGGAARRVLLRHGVDDQARLDQATKAVESALDGGSNVKAWAEVLDAMRGAGMGEAVASSAGRMLAAMLEGEPWPHAILSDETTGGSRVILCACGAEFQIAALASGAAVPEDKGYRASIFGPFESDACHLIFGIFMKQVMSVHVGARPDAQGQAEKA